jgi:hypothetical protein
MTSAIKVGYSGKAEDLFAVISFIIYSFFVRLIIAVSVLVLRILSFILLRRCRMVSMITSIPFEAITYVSPFHSNNLFC